jgi:hypothetical protein
MKRLILLIPLLTFFLLDSCVQLSSGTPVEPTETPSFYRAVYLTHDLGELTVDDRKAHPEVIISPTFDDFKSHAVSKIALWVDKNAVKMIDKNWLNLPPQKYFPLVIVGYNDPLYCFRDTLSVGNIEGPYVDWSKENLEPGFCVWMILKENSSEGKSAIFRSYHQTPTIQDILNVTNPLLEEKQQIQ